MFRVSGFGFGVLGVGTSLHPYMQIHAYTYIQI